MAFSKFCKVSLVFLMALMMSNLPHVATAEAAQSMISTANAVEILSRSEAEAKIRSYLDNAELRLALEGHGLSVTEVSSRIASLSDSELRNLAHQMDQARFGGETIGGLLILVLLVVLIIYLVKRI